MSGGDSAIEAAVSIAEEKGTTVTLSYRGDAFARAKMKNRAALDQAQGLFVHTISGALIFFFSYFWVATQFQPQQIADDLKKAGGYIPGVRPGKPTAE